MGNIDILNTDTPIAIASDHAGYELKEAIISYLLEHKLEVLDLGVPSPSRVDYPDVAQKLCQVVKEDISRQAILICGTGVGMSICANRHTNIRAALCTNTTTAKLAREHNNANVLVLGARLTGQDLAIECVKTFLNTAFSQDERHKKRVEKIDKLLLEVEK